MNRICFIFIFWALVVGCSKEQSETIQLRCGACNRVVYDGPAEVDRNGIKWPVGQINHCKPWDINCVSRFDPKNERAVHWGYEDGRKDALNFYYEKTFDSETHHVRYIEGYKKGYKEIIDVRGLPNKED